MNPAPDPRTKRVVFSPGVLQAEIDAIPEVLAHAIVFPGLVFTVELAPGGGHFLVSFVIRIAPKRHLVRQAAVAFDWPAATVEELVHRILASIVDELAPP